MEAERRAPHRRAERLEAALRYFEELLSPIERLESRDLELLDLPIVYIVGCARSGTTLVYQYLSESCVFTYPTNFLSRFYYAPLIGARLQQMIFESDPLGEILARDGEERFESRLGKTRGPLAPHEFWYFWRRFFPFGDTQRLDEDELGRCDGAGFLRELRGMQTVQSKPLVLKGMILNWHLPYLARLWERSYFVFVRRDAESNARSLLRARREFFGHEAAWYSFKPPGHRSVAELDARRQTAWQVLETNAAIEHGLAEIGAERTLRVDLETFRREPRRLLDELAEKTGLDLATPEVEALPARFEPPISESDRWPDWDSIARELAPRLGAWRST